jgi:hypothetical protein
MAEEAKHQPPVYPPEEVAYAILRCAEKPVREIVVGGGSRVMTAMAALAPRLADVYMEKTAFRGQKMDKLAGSDDSLYRPSHDARRRGNYPGYVMKKSAYTRAALSDLTRALPLVLVGAIVAAGIAARR